ncbi:hypothetical protein D3C71_193530 [compost metagenome]
MSKGKLNPAKVLPVLKSEATHTLRLSVSDLQYSLNQVNSCVIVVFSLQTKYKPENIRHYIL